MIVLEYATGYMCTISCIIHSATTFQLYLAYAYHIIVYNDIIDRLCVSHVVLSLRRTDGIDRLTILYNNVYIMQ